SKPAAGQPSSDNPSDRRLPADHPTDGRTPAGNTSNRRLRACNVAAGRTPAGTRSGPRGRTRAGRPARQTCAVGPPARQPPAPGDRIQRQLSPRKRRRRRPIPRVFRAWMRVALIGPLPPALGGATPGGVASHLAHLADGLARAAPDLQVSLLATNV